MIHNYQNAGEMAVDIVETPAFNHEKLFPQEEIKPIVCALFQEEDSRDLSLISTITLPLTDNKTTDEQQNGSLDCQKCGTNQPQSIINVDSLCMSEYYFVNANQFHCQDRLSTVAVPIMNCESCLLQSSHLDEDSNDNGRQDFKLLKPLSVLLPCTIEKCNDEFKVVKVQDGFPLTGKKDEIWNTKEKGVDNKNNYDHDKEIIQIKKMKDSIDIFVESEIKLKNDYTQLNLELDNMNATCNLLRDAKDLMATENAKLYSENSRLKREIEQVSIKYEIKLRENKLLKEESSLLNTNLNWKTESLQSNLIISDRQMYVISQYENMLIQSEDLSAKRIKEFEYLKLVFERLSMSLEDNIKSHKQNCDIMRISEIVKTQKLENDNFIDDLKSQIVNIQGERNYWEKKSQSLAKDLAKKLEINSYSKLKKEFSIVNSKLEQALFERKAFKDAMTAAYSDLKCDFCRNACIKDLNLVVDCRNDLDSALGLPFENASPINNDPILVSSNYNLNEAGSCTPLSTSDSNYSDQTSETNNRSSSDLKGITDNSLNENNCVRKKKSKTRLGKEKAAAAKTTRQLVDILEGNASSIVSVKKLSSNNNHSKTEERRNIGCFVLGSS